MKDEHYSTDDIMRQYNHLLARGDDVHVVINHLGRIYGESFTSLFNQHRSIREFQESSGQDLTLLYKLRDCLPASDIDETSLVFHYRAMLNLVKQHADSANEKVRQAMNYPLAVGVIALAMFFFNEFFVQPVMFELFASFDASAPDGWVFFRAVTLILLPIFAGYMILIFWLAGKKGDTLRYFTLAISQRRIPVLSTIGQAFRSFYLTSFVRYAICLDIENSRAIDAIRQAVSIAYEDQPDEQNILVLDRLVHNLETSEQLGTFAEELCYWEDKSRDDIKVRINSLAPFIESTNMGLLAIFVGSMIIQIYLWVFSLGDVMI